MPRQSGLTSREELMLHLHAHRDAEQGVEGPYAATREGISETLGMRPNHISRELAHMVRGGDVVFRLAHVLGFRKRVKVYRLSASGLQRAESLMGSLKDAIVTVQDEFGNAESVTLDTAFKKMGGRKGYLDILKMRGPEPGKATGMKIPSEMREPERFVGRGGEMASLSSWLHSGRSSVLVVYGIAGIGKTSLLSRFASTLPDRRKIYLKVREWDTPRGVLQALANFLSGMGDERLQSLMRSRDGEDMTNVSLTLKDMFENLAPLIMIDDVWTSSKDVWRLMLLMCDSMTGTRTKMVFMAREFPLKLEGAMEARGLITRMRLDGLSEEESRQLLESRGITERQNPSVRDIVRTLRGHPLLLKMVRGAEDIRSLSEGDVPRFIHSEIYSRLSSDERALLNTLAVLRYPVPVSMLSKKTGYEALESLHRKSLTERSGENVALHDIMRSFVMAYMDEREGKRCHQLARGILLRSGQFQTERIYHATCAGMVEEAVEELLAEGKALVDEGRAQDVLFLLDGLEKGSVSSKRSKELSLLRMTCYAFMGRYSTVIEMFERGNENIHSDPETILTVAESYLEVGGASKAKNLYARLMNKRLTGELETRLHGGLGRYHTFTGKYDLARKHYRMAIELSKKEGFYEMLGLCLMGIGAVELFCERWQETRRHFLEAMRYVRKDNASLARLYSNLALVYFMRSMHHMGLQMLERAEGMYAGSGNYVGLLKSLLNKGAMHHAMGENGAAESMFLKAEEMSRRAGLRPMLVGALTNLSSVHLAIGRYDLARHDAEEAIRIATELKDERGRIAARNNLGLAMIRTKEAKAGIRVLEDNLKTSDKVGTFGLSADAMEMLSEGYLVLGKAKEARAYAKKALVLARERGMANVVRSLSKSLKIKEALRTARENGVRTSRTRRVA